MIKTSDKSKKRQTADEFLTGADDVEVSTPSAKTRGVKMKSIAILLKVPR